MKMPGLESSLCYNHNCSSFDKKLLTTDNHYRQDSQGNRPAWPHFVGCPAPQRLGRNIVLSFSITHSCTHVLCLSARGTHYHLLPCACPPGLHKYPHHPIFASICTELLFHCHHFSGCCHNTLTPHFSQAHSVLQQGSR